MELTILRNMSKTNSRTTVLDFIIADFGLSEDLLGMIPMAHCPERAILSILTCGTQSKHGRRPAHMNNELLTETKHVQICIYIDTHTEGGRRYELPMKNLEILPEHA